MRTSRFSETEIVYAVEQLEMGISIKEIARKSGVCERPSTAGAGNTMG